MIYNLLQSSRKDFTLRLPIGRRKHQMIIILTNPTSDIWILRLTWQTCWRDFVKTDLIISKVHLLCCKTFGRKCCVFSMFYLVVRLILAQGQYVKHYINHTIFVFWLFFLHKNWILNCPQNLDRFVQASPLTHWGWDKMAANFIRTFSNTFSWMKMHRFGLRYHRSLFQWSNNNILDSIGSDNGLAPARRQAIIWTNDV